MKKIIKYVSAGCGEGKTYSTCKLITEMVKEKNCLYVAPTIQLVKQTAKQLRDLNKNCIITEVHSESYKTPKAEIYRILKAAETCGHILVITWAAYSELVYFNRKENWEIFIDEIPQVDELHKHRVPYNHSFLTDHLALEPNSNGLVGRLKAKDAGKLRYLLENKCRRDDVYEPFIDLFSDVANPSKDVFVDLDSWTQICEFNKIGKNDGANTIYFLSMLNPNLFIGATLLGANIEQSMLFGWLTSYYQVDFLTRDEIISGLRKVQSVAHRLKITYQLSEKIFSKYLRDKIHEGERVIDVMEKSISKEIGDDEFLLVQNNDHEGSLINLAGCKKIDVDNKGINSYQSYTKLVHLVALNREPKHLQLLKYLGIDDEKIRISTIYEVLYQNVMRTSLRNPDSNEVVDVYVATEFEADFLIQQFGTGVSKRKIGDLVFEQYKPLTNSERNSSYRGNKKIQDLLSSNNKKDSGLPLFDYEVSIVNINSHQNCANQLPVGSQFTGCLLNFCTDKKATRQEQFVTQSFKSVTSLVSMLRQASNRIFDAKDDKDVGLVNPVIYKKNSEGQYRKKENFLYASMFIFDFDDGSLSPDDFVDIFWNRAGTGQKRSFVITNTFSTSLLQPNRFRVFMFYKKPATSYEAHLAVYKSVVLRLEQQGYGQDISGLDKTCSYGTQPFYLPCTNRQHMDRHFFKTKGTSARDVERYGIDPDECLKTSLRATERTKVISLSANSNRSTDDESEVNRKIEEMTNHICSLKEGRHDPFFKLAVYMSSHGLDLYEIESRLRLLEQEIGKTAQKWAADAIRSLRNYSRRAA